MRKTKVIKILAIFLLLFIFNLFYLNKSFATEASVSANNCKVGENLTVKLNVGDAFAYEYDVSVTFSDGTTKTVHGAGATAEAKLEKTFEAISEGNATININNLVLYDKKCNVINTIKSLHTVVEITSANSENSSTEQNDNTVSQQEVDNVKLNFNDISEKMYTNRRINVRQGYGTDSDIIQTLPVGVEVTRTGISDGKKNGYSWSRISYNGIIGYVITGALTYDAPEQEQKKDEEEKVEEENTEQPEATEDVTAKILAIAEEKGTIPEVGLNIIPYMFLGAVCSCIFMMFEIKRKLV